jgi:hypothetical protein
MALPISIPRCLILSSSRIMKVNPESSTRRKASQQRGAVIMSPFMSPCLTKNGRFKSVLQMPDGPNHSRLSRVLDSRPVPNPASL